MNFPSGVARHVLATVTLILRRVADILIRLTDNSDDRRIREIQRPGRAGVKRESCSHLWAEATNRSSRLRLTRSNP